MMTGPRSSTSCRPHSGPRIAGLTAAGIALALIGCSDRGTAPPEPVPSTLPTLMRLVPARTVVSDTVRIEGVGFGTEIGERVVIFPGARGATVGAPIVSWSDSEIAVLVPDGASSGGVAVGDGDGRSNSLVFSLAPRVVSYAGDVDPLFRVPAYGCASCHTGFGSGDFVLGSREELLRGDSDHGPVVIRRNGPESVLVKKLRGTAGFGSQMPMGGTSLPAEEILLISDWIDQGTRDN